MKILRTSSLGSNFTGLKFNTLLITKLVLEFSLIAGNSLFICIDVFSIKEILKLFFYKCLDQQQQKHSRKTFT